LPSAPKLKPAPLFLLRSHAVEPNTDYAVLCRANAKLTIDNLPKRVLAWRFLGWIHRFLPAALVALQRYGHKAARMQGRSFLGQFGDMVRLANQAGISPFEYYELGLARFSGSEELRNFISHQFYFYAALACARSRQPHVANQPDPLQDKSAFERTCFSLGEPCVRTIAIIDRERRTDIYGTRISEELPDRDLFAKPQRGHQGRLTYRFDYVGGGCYRAGDIGVVASNALWTFLSRVSAETGRVFLLQEALQNSPAVAAFAGRALATSRIITLLDEAGQPEVVYACFRTAGTATSVVDNYHSKGIAFTLNTTTGDLGQGRRLFFTDDPHFYSIHPVTGAQVEGVRLAHWDKAKALALRLHRASAHLLVAGWDIAFTSDGPRAVEVNSLPGLPVVQMQRGFLGTRYSALLCKHILEWLDAEQNKPFGKERAGRRNGKS
jgi:hypothetical protein